MAIMIPGDIDSIDFHGSFGERDIYESLRSLPNEYVVFHSVVWQQRKTDGYIGWGEADFTIFHAKRGVLVLEVKSGGIKLQKGAWKQIDTLTGEEYKMKDPIVQANRSKYTFIDLLAVKEENINTYPVEVAVGFPSLDRIQVPANLPAAYKNQIIITRNDLHTMEVAINRIFDFYGMDEKPYFTESDKLRCMNVLSPEFNVLPNLRQRIKEEEFVFNRLTREQCYLLDYLTEQRVAAIQGGAGTGKTILALEKAIRLSQDEKVLFLCFNKFLLEYLRRMYTRSYPNISFYNLATLVQETTRVSDTQEDDSILKFLRTCVANGWKYKHIIIDEAQDFSSEQLQYLMNLANAHDGCIYAFYDKNQLVHVVDDQKMCWIDLFECRLVLLMNCRNTKSIATTAYRPIGIMEVQTKITALGKKPDFHIVRTATLLVTTVEQIIENYIRNGFSEKDIVILTVKTEESSALTDVRYIGMHSVKTNVEERGILFTTARKFKGLESMAVIVVDVEDITFSNPDYCKVLYVATSRAKHALDIIAHLNDEKILNVAKAVTGNSVKNPKAVISSTLKVKIIDK